MILYGNAPLFHTTGPSKWLRGTLIPSQARPGWSLLRTPEGLHVSVLPDGTFQNDSTNDGPYEQCQVRGSSLVFCPRSPGEDQVFPAVFDL